MGVLEQNGKPVWVDAKSVHRLTPAESTAFLLFARAEQDRHKIDIAEIQKTILLVEEHIKRTFSKGTIGGEKEKND